MTDVYSLLTFPTTSRGFNALPLQPQTNIKDSSRSASPPRKIARLNGASDARAPSLRDSKYVEKGGPIVLQIVGPLIQATPESVSSEEYALIKRTIRMILDPEEASPLPATYDRVSRACRAVVNEAGKGEGLYEFYKMELERCVGRMQGKLGSDPRRSVDWLVPFTETCHWFEKQVGLLQSILAYLDTLYVAERGHKLPRTKELAYSMFTNTVVKSVRVTAAIMDGMADWLEWERTHRDTHPLRHYIPKVVRHLQAHGLYADMIETPYLNLTHTYYVKESHAIADGNKLKADEFLKHMKRRSNEELTRAQEVLVASSAKSVHDSTDNAILAGRLQWLANDALDTLIKGRDTFQISSMYQLFAKVGGLKVLSAAFKAHLQKEVKSIVIDAAKDDEMVPRLLELKAFADKLVSTCFVDAVLPLTSAAPPQPYASSSRIPAAAPRDAVQPNRDFAYGLIDAFQAGFKARRIKPAEMIAKHLDKAMRRGQKGKRDEDFAAELDEVLGLYRFTDDMDVFRTFYQRALAKRLLLGRSASDDFEKAVLKKLREQYDPDFGNGDKMFNDLDLSRELVTRFYKEKRVDESSSLQKLTAMVLQRSSWPFAARKTDIILPGWMQDDISSFTQYYKSKHQGRTLDWDYALGTATLKARFKTENKELSVSLYQAVVLLLYNEEEELAYADIKEQTRLDDGELRRTLQSLACGKKRVLKKLPVGKDVNVTDKFTFNADFTDPRHVVHINSIQSKETPEETKRTQNSIEADRKHALDAAIVRVMKAKKELTYEQVKTATIEAVKNHFVPEISMIKKRIEGLVEQEYLRRDEKDQNRFFYVA